MPHAPERPRALRLPAGQGRLLRQGMEKVTRMLLTEIPKRLDGADFRAESERIEKAYETQESQAFAALDALAEGLQFRLTREGGHMVFTLIGPEGQPLTEADAHALSRERRAEIETAEQQLRAEIARFLDATRPLERQRDEALEQLRRQVTKPLLDHELQEVRNSLRKQIKDTVKLGQWLDQMHQQVLDHLALFIPIEGKALRAMRPYIEQHLASGGTMHHVTRHVLGLGSGFPGARRFRQMLSADIHKATDPLALFDQAAALLDGH